MARNRNNKEAVEKMVLVKRDDIKTIERIIGKGAPIKPYLEGIIEDKIIRLRKDFKIK